MSRIGLLSLVLILSVLAGACGPTQDLSGSAGQSDAGVDPGVNNPPVNNPPVDEPPVNEPPVNNPPVDEPPVNDPPVNDPPVESASSESGRTAVLAIATVILLMLSLAAAWSFTRRKKNSKT